jgi:hypothetical protein
MYFDFIVSYGVECRVQPKKDDERKDQETVHVQFHRTAKIAMTEKQDCPRDSTGWAGNTEYVFQQAQAKDFPVKGRDYD